MDIQNYNAGLAFNVNQNISYVPFPIYTYYVEKYRQFPFSMVHDGSSTPYNMYSILLLNFLEKNYENINTRYYPNYDNEIIEEEKQYFFYDKDIDEGFFKGSDKLHFWAYKTYEKDGIIIELSYSVGNNFLNDEEDIRLPDEDDFLNLKCINEPQYENRFRHRLYIKTVFGQTNLQLLEFFKNIDKYKIRFKEKKNTNIYSIIETNNQLQEKSLSFTPDKVSIEDNYNDDFFEFYKKLVDQLKNGHRGLYFMHGDPGTGKTKLVTKLASEIKKKVFFLPAHMAAILTSPNFIPFIMSHKNSVILIEEAENSLIDNGGQRSPSVSNILNLTDGILAEALNIQIICTFNVNYSAIDKALTRKGRLKLEYEFKKLSVDKSNNLLKKLGFDYITDEPMTLADIYNFDQETSNLNKPKNKIGF